MNAVISLLIKENKQRIQNTINHYHRNLPPTFIATKNVVRDDRKVKDITFQEVKNTTLIDPFAQNGNPIISSESGEIENKQMYLIPGFLNVNHRKKLNKIVWGAYGAYVKNNQKNKDLHSNHVGALDVAIEEITKYIKWVEKNNDVLVKKFPDIFSYNSPVQPAKDKTVEVEDKGFLAKVKKQLGW